MLKMGDPPGFSTLGIALEKSCQKDWPEQNDGHEAIATHPKNSLRSFIICKFFYGMIG